jgi:hypothetical protein
MGPPEIRSRSFLRWGLVFGADCHFAVHLSRSRRKPSPIAFPASKVLELIASLLGSIGRKMILDRMWEWVRQRATPLPKNGPARRVMRVQITACFLCLMIVGASLDRLPDPPAVKPNGNQNNLVSRLDYHVAIAAHHVLDCPAAAPNFQDRLFSFRQIFESTLSSHKLTFVRQATDTSPPYFS